MRLARDTDWEIVTTMRGKRYTTSIEGTTRSLSESPTATRHRALFQRSHRLRFRIH
jgi:hypothetical protein